MIINVLYSGICLYFLWNAASNDISRPCTFFMVCTFGISKAKF